MRTLTIQLKGENAMQMLEDMERRHEISIVHQTESDSIALPGKPLAENEFRQWVQKAEQSPTVSLDEAKSRWEKKKKQLHRDIS